MIKVAVLGVGSLGQNHARIYSDLHEQGAVELIGVYDTNADQAEAVAAKYGTQALGSVEEAAVADALSVVTPTTTHHRLAKPLLEQGKHLLIEKPMTDNLNEAAELVRLAKRYDCVLQVGHIERFNPVYTYLQKAAKSPRFIESHRLSPFPARSMDIGVVLDLMIHDLDLVLELAGSSVVHLAAAGGRSAEGPIDYVNATLGFENGVVASLTASKMSHRKIRTLSAHCRSSLVETDFLNHNLHIHRRAHEWYSADHGELLYRNDGFIEEVSTTSIEPLYAELEHFLQCVRGRETPAVDGQQASRALKLADLIEQAVEQPGVGVPIQSPI